MAGDDDAEQPAAEGEKGEEEEEEEGPILPEGLWDEVEEGEVPQRQRILEVLCPKPGEDEQPRDVIIKNLLELREKAAKAQFREYLWADVEVRQAVVTRSRGPDPDAPKASLYNEGPEIPDEGIRTVALGVLVNFATAASCRRAMAHDPNIREALLMGAQKIAADLPQGDILRARGFIGLIGLTLVMAVHPKDDEAFGGRMIIDHLLTGVEEGMPTHVKAGVLGTLWSLALSEEADPVAIWRFRYLRDAVIEHATIGQDAHVREQALGLLWALACCDANREAIWDYDDARLVLIEALPPTWSPRPKVKKEINEDEEDLDALLEDSDDDVELGPDGLPLPPPKYAQSPELRLKAIRTMQCLASVKALREDLWADEEVAVPLMDCTRPTECHDIRAASLRVFYELALSYDNQLPMWGAGLHDLFETASQDTNYCKKDRRKWSETAKRIVEGAEWAQWWAEKEQREEEMDPTNCAKKAVAAAVREGIEEEEQLKAAAQEAFQKASEALGLEEEEAEEVAEVWIETEEAQAAIEETIAATKAAMEEEEAAGEAGNDSAAAEAAAAGS
eukprot:TRINITY_DN100878_c0_g1_i1.p1 TRINITY_DN100878_c0_g1~~TRINITY_DN100878_c0_g1_i1.p1  ORF type:complete len:563 (+),score=209.17 TRINITY_DN100878_c0_g1_i1:57-1745(+)